MHPRLSRGHFSGLGIRWSKSFLCFRRLSCLKCRIILLFPANRRGIILHSRQNSSNSDEICRTVSFLKAASVHLVESFGEKTPYAESIRCSDYLPDVIQNNVCHRSLVLWDYDAHTHARTHPNAHKHIQRIQVNVTQFRLVVSVLYYQSRGSGSKPLSARAKFDSTFLLHLRPLGLGPITNLAIMSTLGRGGALVEPMPFDRRGSWVRLPL